MHRPWIVLISFTIALLPACRSQAPEAARPPAEPAVAPAPPSSVPPPSVPSPSVPSPSVPSPSVPSPSVPPPGTVGPLAADCYDTTHAAACTPDPTDPSGKALPAHGGPCRNDVCRPCGSSKHPAFRDERGVASAGFCVCIPKSDDSGAGTFTCYSPQAWKKRGS